MLFENNDSNNLKKPLTLLYGTGNRAKLEMMRNMLLGLPIKIIGLNDIKIGLPEIDESGNDPLENAKIKAEAYFKATGIPVFSCDSGLYINNAPDSLQPGVHVRNVNGRVLTDEEMINYYASLANQFGGEMTVRYKNAICLVINENKTYEYIGDELSGDEFIITSKPHERRTPGFPLDSLSVHIETGKYYYDISPLKDCTSIENGFRNFFKRALNLKTL